LSKSSRKEQFRSIAKQSLQDSKKTQQLLLNRKIAKQMQLRMNKIIRKLTEEAATKQTTQKSQG
jgi:hypothetical protein